MLSHDELSRKLISPNHYVFEAHSALACLTAYAVTQQSARELMGFLLDMHEPTDLAVSRYCASHDRARQHEENEQMSNHIVKSLEDDDAAIIERHGATRFL